MPKDFSKMTHPGIFDTNWTAQQVLQHEGQQLRQQKEKKWQSNDNNDGDNWKKDNEWQKQTHLRQKNNKDENENEKITDVLKNDNDDKIALKNETELQKFGSWNAFGKRQCWSCSSMFIFFCISFLLF